MRYLQFQLYFYFIWNVLFEPKVLYQHSSGILSTKTALENVTKTVLSNALSGIGSNPESVEVLKVGLQVVF